MWGISKIYNSSLGDCTYINYVKYDPDIFNIFVVDLNSGEQKQINSSELYNMWSNGLLCEYCYKKMIGVEGIRFYVCDLYMYSLMSCLKFARVRKGLKIQLYAFDINSVEDGLFLPHAEFNYLSTVPQYLIRAIQTGYFDSYIYYDDKYLILLGTEGNYFMYSINDITEFKITLTKLMMIFGGK